MKALRESQAQKILPVFSECRKDKMISGDPTEIMPKSAGF